MQAEECVTAIISAESDFIWSVHRDETTCSDGDWAEFDPRVQANERFINIQPGSRIQGYPEVLHGARAAGALGEPIT